MNVPIREDEQGRSFLAADIPLHHDDGGAVGRLLWRPSDPLAVALDIAAWPLTAWFERDLLDRAVRFGTATCHTGHLRVYADDRERQRLTFRLGPLDACVAVTAATGHVQAFLAATYRCVPPGSEQLWQPAPQAVPEEWLA